jgi:hypothetical protein
MAQFKVQAVEDGEYEGQKRRTLGGNYLDAGVLSKFCFVTFYERPQSPLPQVTPGQTINLALRPYVDKSRRLAFGVDFAGLHVPAKA